MEHTIICNTHNDNNDNNNNDNNNINNHQRDGLGDGQLWNS